MTGQHTDTKRDGGSRSIFYTEGGERGLSWDTWAQVEMLLLPN